MMGRRKRANSDDLSQNSQQHRNRGGDSLLLGDAAFHQKKKMKMLQDKFDLMEEKDNKFRDKNRDFIKAEGQLFLGGMKFYNPKLDVNQNMLQTQQSKHLLYQPIFISNGIAANT